MIKTYNIYFDDIFNGINVKYWSKVLLISIIIISIISMITLPSLGYANDYGTATYPRVIIYCIEDYNGKANDLERLCAAADTFASTLTSNSSAFVYILQNNNSRPIYWWTEEIGGTPNVYEHAYQWHYIIFLGHGSPTMIYFGVDDTHKILGNVNYVGLASYWYINGAYYPEVYFHRVTFYSAPKWVTLASCQTLNLTSSQLNDILVNDFEGRGGLSNVYLHGIVGMRSDFLDVVKNLLGWIVYDAAVETMKDYATRLINNESIVNAWSNAVLTKQQYSFLGFSFQGHPAAVTLIIQGYDSNGNLVAQIKYDTEKMYTIGTVYADPNTVIQSYLDNGWKVVVTWEHIKW